MVMIIYSNSGLINQCHRVLCLMVVVAWLLFSNEFKAHLWFVENSSDTICFSFNQMNLIVLC